MAGKRQIIKAVSYTHLDVYKRQPSQAVQQGGITREEGKIDASNVLLNCDKCGRGVRTGVQITEDGKKVRVCKKCGQVLDN